MNIADQLQKLQDLSHLGSLSPEEFAAAKAAVLAGNATETGSESALHAHLEEIKHQNEIARLDREWQVSEVLTWPGSRKFREFLRSPLR